MGMKCYKWKTFEDGNMTTLELNTNMIKFLLDAGIEIYSLNLEIYLHGEYDYDNELVRDYDSEGIFYISEQDNDKFEKYINDYFMKMNPRYPDIISISIYQDSNNNE